MDRNRPPYYYSAYGLTLKSEIMLPELIPISEIHMPDVFISEEYFSVANNSSQTDVSYWRKLDEMFHLHITGVADFHVFSGNSIKVCSKIHPVNIEVRIHLLGTCMGIIALQRKILPLHASCVAKGNECLIISGQSGAGKSTLALALCQRGYSLVADDITAIHLVSHTIPSVYPSIAQTKLSKVSADKLGIDIQNCLRIPSSELGKRAVPIQIASKKPYSIKAIFTILPTESENFDILPVNGLKKMTSLINNSYTYTEIIHSFGMSSWHFAFCNTLAKSAPIYQIKRTENLQQLEMLAQTIDSSFF